MNEVISRAPRTVTPNALEEHALLSFGLETVNLCVLERFRKVEALLASKRGEFCLVVQHHFWRYDSSLTHTGPLWRINYFQFGLLTDEHVVLDNRRPGGKNGLPTTTYYKWADREMFPGRIWFPGQGLVTQENGPTDISWVADGFTTEVAIGDENIRQYLRRTGQLHGKYCAEVNAIRRCCKEAKQNFKRAMRL